MIKIQDKNQMNLPAMSAHRLHVKNAAKLLVLVKNLKNTFTDYIEMSSEKDQENENKTKEESLKRKQKEKQEDDELESLEVESTGGGMGAGGGG